MLREPRDLVDALEQTWRSTLEVCRSLTDDDWDRPTGCPGWSVKDNVAHLAGLEQVLMGRPEPDHTVPDGLAHVTGPMSAYMETHVDARRALPPAAVLAEFEEVVSERVAHLRGLDPAAFDEDAPGPMGMRSPLRRGLPIRVFDSYAHEQDIRRAVDRPGNLDTPVATHTRDVILRGLSAKLAGEVGAPEGTVVEVNGVLLTVVDGKGRVLDGTGAGTGEPAARLTTDPSNFIALGCGRSDADSRTVQIEGDAALAARLLDAFGVTP